MARLAGLRGPFKGNQRPQEEATMRPNKVREIWRAGGHVLNGWGGIPNGFSAEIMAHVGWGSLVVGIYVGPSDLSTSLGHAPGLDKPDEFMTSALTRIIDGCKRHGVQPGLHTGSTAYAKRMLGMGFKFVTVMGDARLLTMAGQQI